MFTSKQIAIGIVAAAGLTAGAGAHAYTSHHGSQQHELRALGLGVTSLAPATREARVVVQCGEGRGSLVTVKLGRGVDLAKLTPGASVGAVVVTPDNLVVRLAPAPPACQGGALGDAAASGADTTPDGATMAPEMRPAESSAAGAAGSVSQARSTTASLVGTGTRAARPRRIWTFLGKAKRDDLGVLSLEVDRVNLPAADVMERSLLVDEHVRMVVGRATAIGDLAGSRISVLRLDDATVRVQAAIAAPSAWRIDDEGRRVPTIIAKRIVVLELDQ